MDQSLSQQSDVLVFEPRRLLAITETFVRSHAAELACAALLAIMSLQMFAVIWRKSITIDEFVLIPSAYYHLVDGDFHLVHEHPPLPKLVAAVPLLFVQPNEIKPAKDLYAQDPTAASWARESGFWEQNLDKIDAVSFWPRVPMILLTVGLGVLIFSFTRTLFGPTAAVIAVALFSLEPTILGHGRVVHTDVPAAFGYLLFFMTLYSYMKDKTWRRAVWMGTATACALLAKYSMLLIGFVIVPVFIYEALSSKQWRTVLLKATTTLVSIIVVINAAYFFKHTPFNSQDGLDEKWINDHLPAHAHVISLIAQALNYVLPKQFIFGVLHQFWHNGDGHAAGLLGMYSQHGWWYYFPVAFALKVTLPFLLLTLAALGWSVFKLIKDRDQRFFWLVVSVAIYMVFVLFSHINIGVRYLIPIFPPLIILGAALLDQFIKHKNRAIAFLPAILILGWVCIEAVRAFPNHISYMNQLARNAPHWWYLSDSNVEWGDDTHDLARYIQDKGENRVLDATLAGWGLLHFYHVENVNALNANLDDPNGPRYLAIGASFLNGSTVPGGPPGSGRDTDNGRVNYFAEFRNRKPEAIIGDSIYVFRVR